MKKFLVLLGLSFLNQSCIKNDANIATPPATTKSVTEIADSKIVNDRNIVFGDMEILIPLAWSSKKNDDGLVFLNKPREALIFLGKESCDLSYDQCVLSSVKGLEESNAELLAVDHVFFNNNKFMSLTTRKNGIKVWSWVTHYHGTLYIFSCGGQKPDADLQQDCKAISSTIKLLQ